LPAAGVLHLQPAGSLYVRYPNHLMPIVRGLMLQEMRKARQGLRCFGVHSMRSSGHAANRH
jgi:hypothetical protein